MLRQEKLQQQAVLPVDRLRADTAQFVAAVGQHAQDGQVSTDLNAVQLRSVQRGDRDQMRVDRISLAAVQAVPGGPENRVHRSLVGRTLNE